ncbi:hypothetical protein FRB98_000199, partial [Tulasnella sp. 332]
ASVPTPTQAAANLKVKPKSTGRDLSSSCSSSDSSSSDSDVGKKPTKRLIKKVATSSSSSSSDSENDADFEDVTPPVKVPTAGLKRKASTSPSISSPDFSATSSSSSSSSSDSSSGSEESKSSDCSATKNKVAAKELPMAPTPQNSERLFKKQRLDNVVTTKPEKQKKTPFQRVKPDTVDYAHDGLRDNRFYSKGGAAGDYGERANQDLIVTKGAGFRKEKMKKKRGSYAGGEITLQSHSIKFT